MAYHQTTEIGYIRSLKIGFFSGMLFLGIGVRLATALLAVLTGFSANLTRGGLGTTLVPGGITGALVGLSAAYLMRIWETSRKLLLLFMTLLALLLSLIPVILHGRIQLASLIAFPSTYLLVALFCLLNAFFTDFLLRKKPADGNL
ncbi:MAG: hypothetical protein Kow0037_06070 [Calditrichia bacterium]